jgi:hypothetical protein
MKNSKNGKGSRTKQNILMTEKFAAKLHKTSKMPQILILGMEPLLVPSLFLRHRISHGKHAMDFASRKSMRG